MVLDFGKAFEPRRSWRSGIDEYLVGFECSSLRTGAVAIDIIEGPVHRYLPGCETELQRMFLRLP
jgi:hypothetical protein